MLRIYANRHPKGERQKGNYHKKTPKRTMPTCFCQWYLLLPGTVIVDVRCRVSGVRKKTWKLKLETMIRSFINSLGMMYEMRDDAVWDLPFGLPPFGRVPSFQIINLFWSLSIGIWDLFVIWCLEFDILQCSTALGCHDGKLLSVYITKELLEFYEVTSLA